MRSKKEKKLVSSKDVQALMKQAVMLYRPGKEAVQKFHMDPSIAYSSAYGLLRRIIRDHFGTIQMRFSDNPAKQGWRKVGILAEVPEIIFSVEGLPEEFELACPVTQLEEWGVLELVRERLMISYREDVFKQLRQYHEQGTTATQRVMAGKMFTLLEFGCAQIVPVKYSVAQPPRNLYHVCPDASMLPENHWSNNVLNVVFAGFSPDNLEAVSLGGNGTLKSWVIALRPFK